MSMTIKYIIWVSSNDYQLVSKTLGIKAEYLMGEMDSHISYTQQQDFKLYVFATLNMRLEILGVGIW